MPNITGGTLWTERSTEQPTWGAFVWSSFEANHYGSGSRDYDNYERIFNAAGSNSIYGASATVQPPALMLWLCIKY